MNLFKLTLTALIAMTCMTAHAQDNSQAVLDNIFSRKSVRSYTDQDVTPEQVETILKAVMAGASPVEYMRKYPGRYELMHIKDKYEIGQSGMVGFDAIFKAFPRAGTKAFVVELEQASTPNILKGVRESAIYLRNLPAGDYFLVK